MKGIFILAACCCLLGVARGGEIAFTIDDAPRGDGGLYSGEERTRILIGNLREAGVEDVWFFVNTGRIDDRSRKRLLAYAAAGFHLANHSHSHHWPHKVDLKTYLEDIDRADRALAGLPNVVRYFRYPFLNEGRTRGKRDAIRNHLVRLGYRNGYVTVDNYEWYMDSLLQRAVREKREVNWARLRDLYVEVLLDVVRFYDKLAVASLDRSPKHVLLLHENDITARFIGDLVKALRAEGWRIISPREAYEDPIAQIVPDVLFNNQGRVAAIARSRGVEKADLVHPSEDTDYLDRLFAERGIFKIRVDKNNHD